MRQLSQCLYVHDALAGTRVLVLNGSTYAVEPRGLGLVDLTRADSGETHTLGEWNCSCRDWRYRRSKTGDPCKHILAACLLGLLGPEAETRMRSVIGETGRAAPVEGEV